MGAVFMGKGEVTISNRSGNITLRWRYQGRRFHHALGLPHNTINYGIAEKLKRRIESDIVTGDFDVSLEKYLLPHQRRSPQRNLFSEFLARPIKTQTLAVYKAAIRRYKEKFGDKIITSQSEAESFIQWLSPSVKTSTSRCYVIRLNAIWEWGVTEKIITNNPWNGLKYSIKIPPAKPQALSEQEVTQIFTTIKGHHYEDFITFLIFSGVRMGEAIYLTWGDVSKECNEIWINSPKTNSIRKIKLSNQLQRLLQNRRPMVFDDAAPVFNSITGKRIRLRYFSILWQKILEKAGIPYKKPSISRSTFVTHCLQSGEDPLKLARVTGHSTTVMFKHYLSTFGDCQLPDLFIGAGKEEK
jgi:integrase